MGVVTVLAMPMVLAVSSQTAMGTVMTLAGLGMVMGSVLASTQKRPASLVYSMVMFQFLAGISLLASGLTTSIFLISTAAFSYFFSLSVANSYYAAIWQGTVDSYVQGRVLSARHGVTMMAQMLAYISAGYLAEKIFEPLMANNGALAASLGAVMGTGPGRGIGLLFMLLGCATIAITALAYLSPKLALSESA